MQLIRKGITRGRLVSKLYPLSALSENFLNIYPFFAFRSNESFDTGNWKTRQHLPDLMGTLAGLVTDKKQTPCPFGDRTERVSIALSSVRVGRWTLHLRSAASFKSPATVITLTPKSCLPLSADDPVMAIIILPNFLFRSPSSLYPLTYLFS